MLSYNTVLEGTVPVAVEAILLNIRY